MAGDRGEVFLYKKDGRISLDVPNIADLKEGVRVSSNVTLIANVPWRIHIERRDEKENGWDWLGVYVECAVGPYAFHHSVEAVCHMIVRDHKHKTWPMWDEGGGGGWRVRAESHTYTPNDAMWGLPTVITWDKLLQKDKFVDKDGSVRIDVELRMKKTKGFLRMREMSFDVPNALTDGIIHLDNKKIHVCMVSL